MPTTDLVRRLMKKGTFLEDDWLLAIDTFAKMIKPHLDSFSLQRLGEFECLKAGRGKPHSMRRDHPDNFNDSEHNLNLQGIFGFCDDREPLCLYLWGLSRDYQWVLVGISYTTQLDENGAYEQAQEVHISNISLRALIGYVKPRLICDTLLAQICAWEERQKRQYEQVRSLAHEARFVDMMIKIRLEQS